MTENIITGGVMVNYGEAVTQVRKKFMFDHETFARILNISAQKLRRIEANEVKIDFWQFTDIMERGGVMYDNYWYYQVNSKEKKDYDAVQNIKRLVYRSRFEEVVKAIDELVKNGLPENPYMSQFITWAKVTTDSTLSNEEAIAKLEAALSMTKPNFDLEHPWTQHYNLNEISLIGRIAAKTFYLGGNNQKKAIAIMEMLLESREVNETAWETKATLYPPMMYTLASFYGQIKDSHTALDKCNKGKKISQVYDNMRYIPMFTYLQARILLDMLPEGEKVNSEIHYLVNEAYFSARAMGEDAFAELVKNNAEEYFGIVLSS